MATIKLSHIEGASRALKGVVKRTPLEKNDRLSKKYNARVYLKREDMQIVRSYKLRGAYYFISTLNKVDKKRGVVCASAGNHAQGFAFSCSALRVKGKVFMPQNTPRQKIEKVLLLGSKWVDVELFGDNFDTASKRALNYAKRYGKIFVHPFDDKKVIAGQGTVASEIFQEDSDIDYIFVPIGGGGLASGVGSFVKESGYKTKIIGVEPKGAPSMFESIKSGEIVELKKIDTFIDGAAVKKVGKTTYKICSEVVDRIELVPEGLVCSEMIDLYQYDGIITEPAGALAISALDKMRNKIRGKKVVCIVSGGNNDVTRYPEILEKSLIYKGLKHYFIIDFPQRPGALKNFLENALGKYDDITTFEYMKKNNKEFGPALVGIEIARPSDYNRLLKRMDKAGIRYTILEKESPIFQFLI